MGATLPTIEDLITATEDAFAYVIECGYSLAAVETMFPESFKGGFVLTYKRPDSTLHIEYLDQQFSITLDGCELFGASHSGPFAGNMFSRDHLVDAVDRIANYVRPQITPSL